MLGPQNAKFVLNVVHTSYSLTYV